MLVGAALPIGVTYGHRAASSWRRTGGTGCDFVARVHEDLALLGQLGITDVRLGIDWSWLQPAPGRVDADAAEHLDTVVLAAARAGVGLWPALFEGPVPGWFADEGAFADERAAGRWWPAYVELVAERIGDRVRGWFPMLDPVGHARRGYEAATEPPYERDTAKVQTCLHTMLLAWRDAWRILRGGPPVVTALGVDGGDDTLVWRLWSRALGDGTVRIPGRVPREVPDLAGAYDAWGLLLDATSAHGVEREVERDVARAVGTALRRAADDRPERDLYVAGVRVGAPEEAGQLRMVEAVGAALQEALADGVRVRGAFASPAIADADGAGYGLVTRNRDVRDVGAAWVEQLR
jgi:beta-glucosidase